MGFSISAKRTQTRSLVNHETQKQSFTKIGKTVHTYLRLGEKGRVSNRFEKGNQFLVNFFADFPIQIKCPHVSTTYNSDLAIFS